MLYLAPFLRYGDAWVENRRICLLLLHLTPPLGVANDTGVILVWRCTWGLSTLSVCQVWFPCTGSFLLYACWPRRTRRRWRNDPCHPYILSTTVLSDAKGIYCSHTKSRFLDELWQIGTDWYGILPGDVIISKQKLRFPGHHISWVSDWMSDWWIEYMIFLHG